MHILTSLRFHFEENEAKYFGPHQLVRFVFSFNFHLPTVIPFHLKTHNCLTSTLEYVKKRWWKSVTEYDAFFRHRLQTCAGAFSPIYTRNDAFSKRSTVFISVFGRSIVWIRETQQNVGVFMRKRIGVRNFNTLTSTMFAIRGFPYLQLLWFVCLHDLHISAWSS